MVDVKLSLPQPLKRKEPNPFPDWHDDEDY